MKFASIITIAVLAHNYAAPQPSPFGFKNQFIGHARYFSPEQEEMRTYCSNYWCTNDAHYLFTKSSQYPNVDPCVDFKNFTVNQVEEVDVPDDRKQFRGFQSITRSTFKERMRKVAAAKFDPIKDQNSRMIRVVKNTFRQCLKSPHVLRHIQAHEDLVDQLRAMGGSPYLSKHVHFNPDKFNVTSDSGQWALWSNRVPHDFTDEDRLWTGGSFNMSKFFELEPATALNTFFNLEVGRCDDNAVCLKRSLSPLDEFTDDHRMFEFNQIREVLRTLDDAFIVRPQLRQILVDQIYRPAVERLLNFLTEREKLLRDSGASSFAIRVGDMCDKFTPKLDIDWLTIINSELLSESRLSADDEITVNLGVEMFQALGHLLVESDKK
jgi:hypothetical protein